MPEVMKLAGDDVYVKIAEVLSEWPLYRPLFYSCDEDIDQLPGVIFLYCDTCKKEQRWAHQTSYGPDRVSRGSATYKCRNCQKETIDFYYQWQASIRGGTVFAKFGQLPPLEERIPIDLKLAGEDLDFYKKALRSRNFNYGLGAVSYLRRVVENRMNDLLDLIAEAARQSGFAEDELKKLDQVKQSRRFDDKVTYAADILPPHLKPQGINPIDRLHDITSEGLHSRPDGECIDIFDVSRRVFEYFFRKLQVDSTEAKEFVKDLRALSQK